MSKETLQTLNVSTLIGYTEKRGRAWHFRKELQGDEPNHYPGAVPVDDVLRRLFNWQAVEAQITAVVVNDDGVLTITDPNRKAICRPDTGTILGIFSGQPGEEQGYKIHQYDEWLINKVSTLLGADLHIGSAGLLKGGGVAWVAIEMADTLHTPEGVDFRPFLSAATAHDGSLSSTYKAGANLPVCDNTLSIAIAGALQRVKVKHSRYSDLKIEETRGALDIVEATAEAFAASVKELCETTVTDKQWDAFLESLIPVPEKIGRGRTMATKKREGLQNLWDHDTRVSPWRNTAFGCVQAVNTASHHVWSADEGRAERNMLKAVDGSIDKLDVGTMKTLELVLA